jgi:lysine-specific demethylase/histidyl-hydroxylase NO66
MFDDQLQSSSNELSTNQSFQYGHNLNLSVFRNGGKQDLNPRDSSTGNYKQVSVKDVRNLFSKGATIQALHPQQYNDCMFKVNSLLERYFGCLVGANCYITPPKSQGLPPHHDDVEVLCLQLENTKKWRLYHPLVELATECSGDLLHDDIGPVWYEVTLQPGDLLYLPRGTIHEAMAQDLFSSHMTISTYQQNSWGDLFKMALPFALESAISKEVSFRRGLPINALSYMGEQHSSITKNGDIVSLRKKFRSEMDKMFNLLFQYANVDEACDAFAADFVKHRLPPVNADTLSISTSTESNKNLQNATSMLPKANSPSSGTQLQFVDLSMLATADDDVSIPHAEYLRMYIRLVPNPLGKGPASSCMVIAHSLDNSRQQHMDGSVHAHRAESNEEEDEEDEEDENNSNEEEDDDDDDNGDDNDDDEQDEASQIDHNVQAERMEGCDNSITCSMAYLPTYTELLSSSAPVKVRNLPVDWIKLEQEELAFSDGQAEVDVHSVSWKEQSILKFVNMLAMSHIVKVHKIPSKSDLKMKSSKSRSK